MLDSSRIISVTARLPGLSAKNITIQVELETC